MSASSAPKSLGKATRLRSIKKSPYQEDDKPRRVAIYVRVSMEEQAEGHSLDEQERRCRAFLARDKPHWTLVGVFKDEHSGKTDKRPGFQDLIHLVDEGKVDAILCHHLDRFSRKLHDILVYFKQLEDQGVVLAFAEDRFDFSTANGMLEFHVLAVFADWYLQNLSRETSKGKLGRVLKGEHNNQPPFGYIKGADGKLHIVPEEGEALREGFELYATGTYVDRQIADLFNTRGLHTRKGKLWSKESIRDLLQNDFYYGVIEYRTDLYPGNHPPLVTKELFDQALDARRKHRRAPRANSNRLRTYMLNTLVYCAHCGRTLRAQGSRKYRYYRDVSKLRGYNDCPHSGHGVQGYIIEDQVAEIVQAFTLPEDWQAEIRAALDNESERTKAVAHRKELEAKLSRITELYADGSLDRAQFSERRDEITKELNQIILPSADRTLNLGHQVDTFQHIWPLSTIEEQREMCRLMFERIDVDLTTNRVTRVRPDREFLWFFRHNRLLEEDDGPGFRVKQELMTGVDNAL